MWSWLVENTLVVLALSAAVALGGTVVRARPAIRHVLWLAVLIKLITPPVLSWTALAPRTRDEVAAVWDRHVWPVVDDVTAAVGLAAPLPAAPAAAVPRPELAAAPPGDAAQSDPAVGALAALWALGALALLARTLWRRRCLRTLMRAALPAPRWLAADHARLCRTLGSAAELVVVPGSFAPSTGGLRRARVLWPQSLTARADRTWLRPVLAHELAHVRRRDHWTALLELLAALLYWWHPLYWLVRARVREHAEQACDAWALQLCPVVPRTYADALLRLRSGATPPLAGLSARGGGLGAMHRRLSRVMRGAGPAALPAPALAAVLVALLLALPSWSCTPWPTQDPLPKGAPKPALVRVEHQAGDLVTLRLLDDPLPRLAKGDVLEVQDQSGRSLQVDVADVDDAHVHARILRARAEPAPQPLPVAEARVGAVIQVARHGTLGRPLPRFQDKGDRTLIADYADNHVLEINAGGATVWERDQVFGAWDVEPLANGHLLITEFSVSRVSEIDRQGRVLWTFDELRNPYDADRLPNGNTLIADTFNDRVIEVDPKGNVVWHYQRDVRPFDVERLEGGNTLIADAPRDRVLEIDAAGTLVWEARGLASVHDADRLPNGHTLITLRAPNRVVEIDADGAVVFALASLAAPSDADRLSNGHTLVAERNQVREFDQNGVLVSERGVAWAVEAVRY